MGPMMTLALPPNPEHCQTLTDAEFSRLKRTHPNLWRDPNKTCLLCRKTGSFQARLGGEIVTYDCNCIEQWKLHLWLLNAGIGHRYQKIAWRDLTEASSEAKGEIEQYLNIAQGYTNGVGLTLWSPERGTGKTSLGTLVLKWAMSQGLYGCYSIQFTRMLDAFTAGWRSKEDRDWFTARILNAGVLFIDEIGKEHKGRSEVAETMVESLLRERVASDAPTILATNYTSEQIKTGYGSDVVGLLSESNISIECPGSNYRMAHAQQTVVYANQGLVQPFTIGFKVLA